MRAYRTLGQCASAEFIEKKSRFIGHACPVETEEEALAFLERIRREHRDATHNCYAYTVGQNMGIMRYSDDGEPGGTAGLPMMDVLKKRDVRNCCVVVTRYFGGVLLGAGGLVRAYTRGTAIALDAARVVVMEPSRHLLCEVSYPLWDRVQHWLKDQPVQLLSTEFTTAVTFTLAVRERDEESVETGLVRLTESRVEILPEDVMWQAWDVNED